MGQKEAVETAECLCWRGRFDQSEVLETEVSAPNLLYQLPSVLTVTVSFPQKNLSCGLSIASLPVSSPSHSLKTLFLFSGPKLVFFFFFFSTYFSSWCSSFMPIEVRLPRWIPSPNPFVQASFLSVICVNHNTVVCHCFNTAVTWALQKNASFYSLWYPATPNMAVKVLYTLADLYLIVCQLKLCQQDMG